MAWMCATTGASARTLSTGRFTSTIVNALAFSPDSVLLATATWNAEAWIWDAGRPGEAARPARRAGAARRDAERAAADGEEKVVTDQIHLVYIVRLGSASMITSPIYD